MKSIDIFYQGENIPGIEHLEFAHDGTFGELHARLVRQHSLPADVLIFIEGDERPIEHGVHVAGRGGDRGVAVHVHRCRHVNVAVTFNNTSKEDVVLVWGWMGAGSIEASGYEVHPDSHKG